MLYDAGGRNTLQDRLRMQGYAHGINRFHIHLGCKGLLFLNEPEQFGGTFHFELQNTSRIGFFQKLKPLCRHGGSIHLKEDIFGPQARGFRKFGGNTQDRDRAFATG